MKPTKHILLLAAILLCSINVNAAILLSGACGDNLTYILEDDGTLTISGTGDMDHLWDAGDLYSPWEGKTVKKVLIEEGVTSIGTGAFCYCSSLASITIPSSVTYIGYYAFEGCSSLTAVHISSIEAWCEISYYDYESNPLYYAHNLYLDGVLVTNLVIPEGVTSIGGSAFEGCSSLTTITIPESVTSIGNGAFRDCSSLTSIALPESVTSIGGSAFDGTAWYDNQPDGVIYAGRVLYKYKGTMPANTSVEVKEGTVSIGSSAFSYCSSLTAIVIPEGVTSIGGRAFSGCSSLTAIVIPEGVTSIGDRAFSGCSSLTAITLLEGVTSIGYGAFSDCRSLTAIVIPESVTSIGGSAFEYCSSLNGAFISAETPPTIGTSVFPNNSFYIYVPASSVEAYKSAEGWSGYENIQSTDLIRVDGIWYEFITKAKIAKVSSPTGIKYAGSISIPATVTYEGVTYSVTSIGNNAFSFCSSLTSINIPESVTSIEEYAFYNCSSLTSITIPEGVTSIGGGAFRDCSSLTSITLPESVTSIGDDFFCRCSSLTSIIIPESVTSIGWYAFRDCSRLTAIVLPEKLKSVGSKAFANCTELLDVYCYAESVPSASSDAFDGSYPEYITLHVPSNALENYKTISPWSSFGTIVTLGASITDITLSQSSATLYEGDSLALTAAVTPSNADMNLISWSSSNPNVATVNAEGQVTAMAPGTTTITITANDGSGVSASCEVEVKEKLLGKCATPVVNYVDGKVMLTCETEEATIVSVTNETTEYAVGECEETEFDLIPTYTITAYATKAKYETSDVVTATLCWVPCDENHGGETTDIINIPAKPVLIHTDGGTITVNGLADGTEVKVYELGGNFIAETTAESGTATITTGLTTGSVAIVKIGERSVKVAIK